MSSVEEAAHEFDALNTLLLGVILGWVSLFIPPIQLSNKNYIFNLLNQHQIINRVMRFIIVYHQEIQVIFHP
jgi:hypothetical protein